MKKVITLLAIIMIIVMGFALIKGQHTSSKNNQHRQITIVASTDFYAELAQTVVGSHGKATAIIKNQNISPEDYEPTTAVAKEVSQADIVLANGLGYDTWLNKLAKASDQAKLIRVGETVLKQKTGSNPHLWNNPETMIKTAHYLAKQLGQQDPTHKADFQKNANKYIASLKPIQSLITQISKKSNGHAVAQTEPVFEYMLKAMGYHVMDSDFSEAIEAGNDPSPTTLATLKSAIENHKITFIVNNKQTSSTTVSNIINLAKTHHIPVVNVTETIPNGENYVSWKLSELQQIAKITQ
ncbi:metal ABC transporter solute-binding protein [Leuconostoc falkenbergense]|jgi:zinc/manganese transport system substrate-binding protein|uniref:Metal ABC transporter solute-binding protein n=1 Tax=Leuconostoc falkenbergense TaxID=2766470 RepID=A0A9X3IPZ5_9LACO|nr:metal ABC transporter solute-binding protein [Leuconostoc falkenbergense]RDG18374.1 metal ABC transporter substrate-binding protein [Leuconostoc pseudomesenteroides]MCT4389728.1 metal ABC transporter substrate-binding protein [Leuconostoc falkenbergense]MCT4411752.1 metal ABC transporter substrate-binding protein [Leuconostoc falkenbergense]MCX7577945.1 metal ABC transporter substrate-binding protein [Leuconostoc falkenbergense]MDM7645949.1 metal ABC transporter solute-binding protein [Leuc